MRAGFIGWVLCACCCLGDAVPYTGSGISLTNAPFISPHAIHRLFHSSILSMDLDTLNDNFFGQDFLVEPADNAESFPTPYFEQEIPFSVCRIFFSYRFMKRLPNGIDILYAIESGGGSGTFHSLYFVKVETATIIESGGSSQLIKKQIRSLQKVGEYSLGDRYRPARPFEFNDNRILIPETAGWFAGHPDHADCCNKPRAINLALP